MPVRPSHASDGLGTAGVELPIQPTIHLLNHGESFSVREAIYSMLQQNYITYYILGGRLRGRASSAVGADALPLPKKSAGFVPCFLASHLTPFASIVVLFRNPAGFMHRRTWIISRFPSRECGVCAWSRKQVSWACTPGAGSSSRASVNLFSGRTPGTKWPLTWMPGNLVCGSSCRCVTREEKHSLYCFHRTNICLLYTSDAADE